jgi:hypothetical protein
VIDHLVALPFGRASARRAGAHRESALEASVARSGARVGVGVRLA